MRWVRFYGPVAGLCRPVVYPALCVVPGLAQERRALAHRSEWLAFKSAFGTEQALIAAGLEMSEESRVVISASARIEPASVGEMDMSEPRTVLAQRVQRLGFFVHVIEVREAAHFGTVQRLCEPCAVRDAVYQIRFLTVQRLDHERR